MRSLQSKLLAASTRRPPPFKSVICVLIYRKRASFVGMSTMMRMEMGLIEVHRVKIGQKTPFLINTLTLWIECKSLTW
jgi:hypothetical protein